MTADECTQSVPEEIARWFVRIYRMKFKKTTDRYNQTPMWFHDINLEVQLYTEMISTRPEEEKTTIRPQ